MKGLVTFLVLAILEGVTGCGGAVTDASDVNESDTVGAAATAPNGAKVHAKVDAKIVALAEAIPADAKWIDAEPVKELDDPSLARTLLPSGKYAGALFAAVKLTNADRTQVVGLALWIERYDGKQKKDVAYRLADAKRAGLVPAHGKYVEEVPMFPLEDGVTVDQVPSLVTKKGDANVYVRWPAWGGQDMLFVLPR